MAFSKLKRFRNKLRQTAQRIFATEEKSILQAEKERKAAPPTPRPSPFKGIANTGSSVRDIARETPRNILSASMSLSGEQERVPKTRIEKALLGDQPVRPLARRVAENELSTKDALPDKYKKFALPAAFAGTIGSTVLDVLPGGKPSREVAESVVSYITKDGKKVFTKLAPDELKVLRNEVKNIPTAKGEYQIHLDADTPQLRGIGKELSRDEFIKGHSQASTVFDNAAKGKRFIKDDVGKFQGSRKTDQDGFAAFPAESIADAGSAVRKNTRPSLQAVGAEGRAGRELAERITRASDVGEVNAGKRISALRRAPKMTWKEKLNLTDVLEGRAEPMSDQITKAAKVYRETLDDVAQEATESGVKVKRKGILNNIEEATTAFQREQIQKKGFVKTSVIEPFKKRENYFPHVIPGVDQLTRGKLRSDIADGMVQRGVRETKEEAEKFIDEFVDFVKTGKQQDSLLDFMVSSGQAKNTSEAFANLQKFRKRTIKKGATEFGREADLPFYDPDPERAVTQYLSRESKRLPQIREFGQKNETVNKLIKEIRDSGGDADFTRTAVDRILQIANDTKSPLAKTALVLRTIQGFKLGLAGVSNMTQGVLNSWLKGDLRAVFAGLAGAMTKSGKEFANMSGATLDSVLDEAAKTTGALKTFLRATGFTATERFNRRLAASAGRSYGTRLFPKALKGNKRAVEELKEFGVDVAGKTALTDDDVLMISKKFTDITQFRSRPQDLPLFASSEAGKTIFQFKNFIYGQTRFMARQTFGEFRRGNFGRGTRNLLILATVFPLAGEAVADIRAAIQGKERDSEGLRRYFDNLGQVGGLGILWDTFKAGEMGKGTQSLVGPTFSDAGDLVNAVGQGNVDNFLAKRVPIFGSRINEALTQKPKPKRKRTRQRSRLGR